MKETTKKYILKMAFNIFIIILVLIIVKVFHVKPLSYWW